MRDDQYDELVIRLRAAGCVYAEDEARLLLSSEADPADLERMVADRVGGTPLEQVLGWAEFGGLRITVVPGVFVPRRRSEVLVAVGLEGLAVGAVVVDLCCGSGAVGAAIASRVAVELHATDIDPVAGDCAARNLAPYAGTVHCGNLFDSLPAGLRGRVDLVVANAPYVPTDAIALMPSEARDHEPHAALDGGADGTEWHRRIAAAAGPWLSPTGRLAIETSPEQSALTVAAFEAVGLTAEVVRDEEIDGTAVVGHAVLPE
jgi:release factor glutamine methyltransferase